VARAKLTFDPSQIGWGLGGGRRDALFELLEALLWAGPVPAAVHLSLAPLRRRG